MMIFLIFMISVELAVGSQCATHFNVYMPISIKTRVWSEETRNSWYIVLETIYFLNTCAVSLYRNLSIIWSFRNYGLSHQLIIFLCLYLVFARSIFPSEFWINSLSLLNFIHFSGCAFQMSNLIIFFFLQFITNILGIWQYTLCCVSSSTVGSTTVSVYGISITIRLKFSSGWSVVVRKDWISGRSWFQKCLSSFSCCYVTVINRH